MKILRSFSIIAGLALLGNVLGYIRDLALASNFGASTTTDAYFAAFFVPNTLYLILLSSSVATVFLPVFVKYLQKDKKEAWEIASTLFNFTFLFLTVVIILAAVTAQYWIPILFSGLDGNTTQLAINLTLILLPMLLFIGLSNLLSNILYSFEHFTVPAMAPVVANIFVIGVILVAGRIGSIRWVAIGVTLSMLLQLIIQIPVLIKVKARYSFTLDLKHPAFIRIIKLSLPLIAYFAIAYASLAVERNIASSFAEGTISAVNYATRLFSIPIAFFAGSLGTVIYPRLSLEIANESADSFSNSLMKAIGATTLFLLPFSLFLFINSRTIVNLLFGYGRFTAEDVLLTTVIFRGYLIGMMAAGVTRIVQRAFYALQDTSTLLIAEMINFPVYVIIVLILSRLIGPASLGISRGFSFLLVAVLSILMLSRHAEIRFEPQKVMSIVGRYSLAGILASAAWVGFAWAGNQSSFSSARLVDFLFLTLTGFVGFIVFGIVAYFLKLQELQIFKDYWINLRIMFIQRWRVIRHDNQ